MFEDGPEIKQFGQFSTLCMRLCAWRALVHHSQMRTTESELHPEIAMQTSQGAAHAGSADPFGHDFSAIISSNNEKSLETRQSQHIPCKWKDHPIETRVRCQVRSWV